jgi:competence protein ComEC
MLSNLVIIPFLGAVLIGGLALIILSLLDILPQIVAGFYADIIHLLNHFISWIAKQEAFLFQDISFSILMMLGAYIVIIFIYRFFTQLTAKRCLCCLVVIISFQSIWVLESYQKSKKREFLVFHKSKNTLIGNRIGEQFTLYHDVDTILKEKLKMVIPYAINENITIEYNHKIPNIFQIEKQTILLVDSLAVYNIKNIKQPIVLLQQSPKINLERLITTIQPKLIICDGSNYKSYVKRWKKVAEKQKTPFYDTSTKGAFKL